MITNRSPLWIRAMAEMEEDTLISVVDSHITSEFLEATCPSPFSSHVYSRDGSDNGSVSTDPFYLTPAQQSALHARSTSPTGINGWAGPTGTDPCPTCGRRAWWAEQDANPQWFEDEEDDDDLYADDKREMPESLLDDDD